VSPSSMVTECVAWCRAAAHAPQASRYRLERDACF
jgi:hypothetical protein